MSEDRNKSIWENQYSKLIVFSGILLIMGLLTKYLGVKLNILTFRIYDIIFIVSSLVGGYEVIKNGIYSTKNRKLDMNILITIAIIGSLSIGYYIEASSLAFLFGVAELLEDYALNNARSSLNELVNLKPQKANVKKNNNTERKEINNVNIGDIVVIKPGDKIPVDGKIKNGKTSIDESAITGESIPIDKEKGDKVFAGTMNKDGYIEVVVKSEHSDTVLSGIIETVEKSNRDQTEKEKFIARFTGYYTPVIVLFALIVAVIPPLIFNMIWETWIIRGLTLLVVACPCAFAISTPVAVVSSITSASRNGVLIRSSKHLEKMADIDVIAMDKTGTITTGQLEVDSVITESKNRDELLKIVHSLESKSDHPIAKTISNYCSDYEKYNVKNFENLQGSGIKGFINNKEVRIGNKDLFNIDRIDMPDNNKTTVIIGESDKIYGYITISDEIRESSLNVITQIKKYNIDVIMLTGDNESVASDVSKKVGIDEYYSSLKPDEKLNIIEDIKENKNIAMVGDGINDAPALKVSDVGISMGSKGSDTAIQSSDIALMNDNLLKIIYIIKLSKKSINIIKQNVYSSILAKFMIAILVPFGFISVAVAILIGDMGMSLLVIGNSMRLSYLK